MRFLGDMGVSMTTLRALRVLGHDAIHLRDEGLIRLPDDQIVAKAKLENRVVLTFDLDFGDIMAASHGESPSVILFRLRNQRSSTRNKPTVGEEIAASLREAIAWGKGQDVPVKITRVENSPGGITPQSYGRPNG